MNTDIFSKNDGFLMLALDHDESFRKIISPHSPDAVLSEDIINLKKRIIAPLLSRASGVLIDSEHGLPAYKQATESHLKSHPPFVLRAEASGYEGEETARLNKIVYTAAQLKKQGASGVKLLIYFNPYSSAALNQIDVARTVLADARKEGMPLFIEIVTYNVPGFTARRSELILSSVERFIKEGVVPDVWKLEFPEDDQQVCFQMTQLVKSTPWILLSRGVSFGVFEDQLEKAVEGGARGFLVGRALWKEVADYRGKEQDDFLGETIPLRFEDLSKIVQKKSLLA
ncbi:MAG: DUF2090 domain-containing protein [Candidatus Pacebacteria bacterium]|nr:DUF2090 domain-containing protein [Candidatus Paceibacterota bacterium]